MGVFKKKLSGTRQDSDHDHDLEAEIEEYYSNKRNDPVDEEIEVTEESESQEKGDEVAQAVGYSGTPGLKRRVGPPTLIKSSPIYAPQSLAPVRNSQGEKRIKVYLNLPPAIHARLKTHAFMTNARVCDLVEDLVAKYCPEYKAGERAV